MLQELRGIRGWRTQTHTNPSSPTEAAWFFITLFTENLSEQKTYVLICKANIYNYEIVHSARLVIRSRQSLAIWGQIV